MTARPISRFGYPLSVSVLVVAIVLLAGFLLFNALPELSGLAGDRRATPSPTASPLPTSPMARSPIGIQMSPDADCGACHLDPGGVVGTKPVPVMAHPLEGWTDCTACHADDRLVRTAPGHSSLHKSDCLTCHKPPATDSAAPARPHHLVTGKTCVSCHGTKAPLPTDMQGRNNCWLCHPGTEFNDLFGTPASTLPPLPSVLPGG